MKAQSYLVTPEVAKKWLESRGVDFQRHVSPSRVSQYAAEMEGNRWLASAGGPIEFVKNDDNSVILVNGQHRLAAVVKAKTPIEFLVITHDGDEKKAREMYSVYDLQGRRKFKDVWGNGSLNPRDRSMLGAALAIIICLEATGKISVTNVSTSERISIADEWVEHFNSAKGFYSNDGAYRRSFENGPTQAAMMYTLRYSQRAKSFWGAVVSGDASINSPQRVMREFIISHHKRTGEAHSYMTQMHRVAACSICWNAFIRGEEIKQLKPNSVKNITFIGTPLK